MVPESGVNPLERLVTDRLRKIFPSKVRCVHDTHANGMDAEVNDSFYQPRTR